jgi:hypothetical protein
LAIITAVKPANLAPACRACGRPMRFGRAISKFRHHPELRIYECDECRQTVVQEWRPREDRGRKMPNSGQGATTLAAGLNVLSKEWGIRNFDMAVILGTWAGSIGFGWKQQPYWLVAPMAVCVAYMTLIGRRCPWAARRLGRGGRKISQAWMSARATGLALFKLARTWRRISVEGCYRKKQDFRRDLARETVCPEEPLLLLAGRELKPACSMFPLFATPHHGDPQAFEPLSVVQDSQASWRRARALTSFVLIEHGRANDHASPPSINR